MCRKPENTFTLTSEKNDKVLFEANIKSKNDKIEVIVERETFRDLIVVYGVNLDKKTTLHELLKKSTDEKSLGDFFAEVCYLSSLVYRCNESDNTIYEHNFVIQTADKWDDVPRFLTNVLLPDGRSITRSRNGNIYYSQTLSVKGEGPALPDSYFNDNGFVDEPTLHLALATAEYYSSYFDREELSVEEKGYITPEHFVTGNYALGGQEYIEAKCKAKVNDMYGWLSFLAHDSLFWRIIDGCGSGVALGLTRRGVARQTSTVPSRYSYSKPNVRTNYKNIYYASSNTAPKHPNLPLLKRSLIKREIGSCTKVKFEGNRVYAWLKSKGGVGPIRKHRTNRTANRAELIKRLEKESIEIVPPVKF